MTRELSEKRQKVKLILEDGSVFKANSFGAEISTAGEVVFTTGMVGYPESLTDPSYFGQILIFTYPLIGNYGVPASKFWESGGIKVKGVIVSNYINTPSHNKSLMTLSDWLKKENIPGLEIKDTRFLTKKIRERGSMLGKIVIDRNIYFYDPNKDNLVNKVSAEKVTEDGSGAKNIVLIDCGAKENIKRALLKRKIRLTSVPWDLNLFDSNIKFDGIVISNGPGDPHQVTKTIEIVKEALNRKIPILGICLGNQILALAANGSTYKMKFGHRGQNQPCLLKGTNKLYLTTQNHGFALRKIPSGFSEWFSNANDGTNEGIKHDNLPFMSVQFHPEACPGPTDTDWIFDYFLKYI